MSATVSRQRQWEAKYHAGETGWDRGQPSPALQHWLTQQTIPAGRVLVPGCGNGHEVIELARAGHAVTAVDIAAPPVMRLMGKLADAGGHARVVQADLLHWTPAEPFDAIYEQTCLCAFDPALWPAYAERLGSWIVPGGRLFALFMQTGRAGGPPFDSPLERMRELFSEADWIWPDEPPIEVAHPNGLVELAHVLTRRDVAATRAPR